MTIVGAFWGCTNPWIRKGALESASSTAIRLNEELIQNENNQDGSKGFVSSSSPWWTNLSKFKHLGVWLPYILNQAGSGVYYALLANSNLTMAVPICNGLALVFSSLTSHWLGERVDKPVHAILGAILVMMGTGLCMMTQIKGEQG